MIIDVARDTKTKSVIGASVAGGIGLLAVVSALTGQTTGGSGAAVAVGIVGGRSSCSSACSRSSPGRS
ncbi:hypothetical protein [Nonomuraea salmonea]|uniref:hypothetical protein n=1 Tax=Nonomuraea salmonea TaxID=46181 RepID=UPI0031EDD34B